MSPQCNLPRELGGSQPVTGATVADKETSAFGSLRVFLLAPDMEKQTHPSNAPPPENMLHALSLLFLDSYYSQSFFLFDPPSILTEVLPQGHPRSLP